MKKTIRSRSANAARDQAGEPRLGDPELRAHLRRLALVVEIAQLDLDPGRDRDRGRACPACMRRDLRGNLLDALVDVGDVEDRLRGEREQPLRGVPGGVGNREVANRGAGAERLDDLLEPVALGDRLLGSRARLLDHPLEPALGLLEVGGEQLGLDQVDVLAGVDAALRMRDPAARMTAHHVTDRVGLADRGQELVAQALSLRRPRHQPGDVMELDRLVDELARAHGRGHLLQPFVGDRRPPRRSGRSS